MDSQEGEPPANLVGVPLGVPDGTEVIDWSAAVDQVVCIRVQRSALLKKRGSLARRSKLECSYLEAR